MPDYLRDESEGAGKGRWLAVAIVLLLLTGGGALLLRAKAPEAWRRLTGQVAARPEVDERPAAPDADETAGSDADAADAKSRRSPAGESTDDADRQEQASSPEETEKPQAPSQRESAEKVDSRGRRGAMTTPRFPPCRASGRHASQAWIRNQTQRAPRARMPVAAPRLAARLSGD